MIGDAMPKLEVHSFFLGSAFLAFLLRLFLGFVRGLTFASLSLVGGQALLSHSADSSPSNHARSSAGSITSTPALVLCSAALIGGVLSASQAIVARLTMGCVDLKLVVLVVLVAPPLPVPVPRPFPTMTESGRSAR